MHVGKRIGLLEVDPNGTLVFSQACPWNRGCAPFFGSLVLSGLVLLSHVDRVQHRAFGLLRSVTRGI